MIYLTPSFYTFILHKHRAKYETTDFETKEIQIPILALPYTSYVIWGKLPNFSEV